MRPGLVVLLCVRWWRMAVQEGAGRLGWGFAEADAVVQGAEWAGCLPVDAAEQAHERRHQQARIKVRFVLMAHGPYLPEHWLAG